VEIAGIYKFYGIEGEFINFMEIGEFINFMEIGWNL